MSKKHKHRFDEFENEAIAGIEAIREELGDHPHPHPTPHPDPVPAPTVTDHQSNQEGEKMQDQEQGQSTTTSASATETVSVTESTSTPPTPPTPAAIVTEAEQDIATDAAAAKTAFWSISATARQQLQQLISDIEAAESVDASAIKRLLGV